MASHQSLREELECPVCLEYPKDPKVMGKCLHAACLDCLKNLVAARCSNSFPCPVCRENCMVPPNGVIGLKDDFRLRTLVEKYQIMIADMTDKSLIHCIVCPNTAFHLCKKCDNIYMCKDCSRKHSRNPLTAAHELFGICSKHGKKVDMFCRECNTAICSACLIADHPTDSHNVVPHQEVVEEEAAEVVEAVEKLDRIRRERKIAALGNIIDIRDSVVATINSDLIEIGKQSDSAIEHAHKKHSQLKVENNGITEQSEEQMKRKDAVDKEIVQTEQKEASLRQQKEEFSNYLNLYREACMNEFLEAMTQAEAESDKINVKVDLGHKLTSSKPLLDGLTVANLLKVKEDLTKAITAAAEDGVAQYANVKENMARFVPNSAPMEIGRLIRRKFARMEKFADISFPSDRPSEGLQRVVLLADGRLASLYRSKEPNGADTISLHDLSSPAVPHLMIDKNIHPAVDMTVTSTGELLVLRMAEPAVRAFNAHSGDFRDINISFDEHEDRVIRSIETDEEGNIFVADSKGHLCAFKPDGAPIKDVKTGIYCPRVLYCELTRTIYIAGKQTMLRYHWEGATFKEMSSFAHGLDGFNFHEVSIGSGGEVFVAGKVTPTLEVLVFQVAEIEQPTKQKEPSTPSARFREDNGRADVQMIKLTFADNVTRKIASDWLPDMCVFGNTLALCLKDTLELFHLKP